MSRRTISAAFLAAAVTLSLALPLLGLGPHAAARSCSDWTSEQEPPPTIRVLRHETGAVETVGFRRYAKNVLSREWIPSWTTASLRSGAMAVKHYAWYHVLHWRGGTNDEGECYDVRDDVVDQVYDPTKPIYPSAREAVNSTWPVRVLRDGEIFPTYYGAGDPDEECGANKNGHRAFQWGTQACGLDGKKMRQILHTYYYPNVTIVRPPAPTPTPSPSPSG
jgi:peptidoglycan hydrolase-like amidase